MKLELSATDQNNDVKLMGDAVIALNIEIMSKEVKDFFSTYSDFVKKVTSEPSLDIEALKTSMQEIEDKSPIESARLMTAALGLGSESGEFVEIVKKMFLQGKPPSKDNIFHMKRELGDIMWYWITACSALKLIHLKSSLRIKKNLNHVTANSLRLKKVK